MQNFKLVVVGDGNVGKTCLLIASQTGSFPSVYVPSVVDFQTDILTGNRVYNVGLWDTGGGEDYHRLRPLSYPETDAFLICFDVSNRNSFENIEHYWIPEIRHFCPDTANILVGNKIDLRSNAANNDRSPQDFVTYEEGRQLASKLDISTYLECSALTHEAIDAVIPTAVRTAIRENPTTKRFLYLGKNTYCKKSDSASTSLSFRIKITPSAEQAPQIEITTSTFANEWQEVLTGQDTSCTDVKFIIAPDNFVLHAHQIVLVSSSSDIFKDIFLSPKKLNQVPKRYSKLFEEIKWIHNKPSNGTDSNNLNNLNLPDSSMEETNESECVEITLNKSINYDVFMRILEFLYTGLPGFSESGDAEFVQEIKKAAEMFHLDWLKQVCENIENNEAFLNPSIARRLNNDFGSNMKHLFLNKPQLSDVKFRVDGKLVYAHKAVLTARCDVMAAMLGGAFMEGRNSSEETEIKDANLESFLAILEYLYTDHAPIEEGDAIDIMVLADRFCLSRLVTICELYFTKKVDKTIKKNTSDGAEYVVNLLLLSQAHNAQQLSNWCLYFIATNYSIFESIPSFSLVQGINKECVEEHRWPPLSYINDLQEYQKELLASSKDSNYKCCIM